MFKEWIRSIFSVSETRVSTLVIILFIFSGFSLWQFINTGDIAEGMRSILVYCLCLIAGVNVGDGLFSAVENTITNYRNKDKIKNETELEIGDV